MMDWLDELILKLNEYWILKKKAEESGFAGKAFAKWKHSEKELLKDAISNMTKLAGELNGYKMSEKEQKAAKKKEKVEVETEEKYSKPFSLLKGKADGKVDKDSGESS